MKLIYLTLLWALGLALSSVILNSAIAAEPSGRALSYTCAGCHGTDGSSVGPSSPHIAGLDEEYFFDTMKAYQNNERNSTIMNRLARGYSDGEIKSMAKWFSEQKLRTTAQSIDTAKAEKGAELHDKYCEKCHEDKGRDSADAGVLAGQWMPYLEYSLQDYHNGKREMTKKMKKKLDSMVKKEGDQSIEDIIHFYGSQE